MEKPSLDFLPYSTDRRSMRRDANPDPVPPPKEWNTKNPCELPGFFTMWSKSCQVYFNIS
jgi:hypothetical protein